MSAANVASGVSAASVDQIDVGPDAEALLELADRVVGWAQDGEQVEAFIGRSQRTSVVVYDGEVESLSQATSAGIGVRVVVDGRQGFAYAGSLDPDVLAETLAEARDNVVFAAPDEANGLARPDGVAAAALDVYRRDLAAVPTSDKVELALELERRVRAGDPRIRGIRQASYGDSIGTGAIVTNTGIRAVGASTSSHVAVLALAGDGAETQTGGGVSVGRHPDELDLDEAATDAVTRATRMLGARKAPTQRLTVILEPEIAAAFLGIIGSTLSGEAVLKGRSLFADRLGERVAAPSLTLVDDPTNPQTLAADPFDGEGLASRRNVLFDAGVLHGFLYDTWSARRAGTTSTASAVRGYSSTPGVGARALSVVPGSLDQEALLASVGDGLLVQGVTGLHSGVNPVSGDFSVGAEGMMVRGGSTAEPVREITIASSLQRMLLDVVEVGADLEWLPGGTGAVSIAIRDVSMSGA